ncbi:hypothetical protein HHI36_010566, partial [Cryptolaemus montrouzieri]
TWFHKGESEFVKIDGYRLVTSYERIVKGCRGACIYSDSAINSITEEKHITMLIVVGTLECAGAVSVKDILIIISLYASQKYGTFEDFSARLEEMLVYVIDKYVNFKVILAGDFNLDLFEER